MAPFISSSYKQVPRLERTKSMYDVTKKEDILSYVNKIKKLQGMKGKKLIVVDKVKREKWVEKKQ